MGDNDSDQMKLSSWTHNDVNKATWLLSNLECVLSKGVTVSMSQDATNYTVGLHFDSQHMFGLGVTFSDAFFSALDNLRVDKHA